METGVAILIPDLIDFKTKIIIRDKEGPCNPTSGYLFEEMQNTTLKRHVNLYVYCSSIYYGQEMETAWVSISR